MRHKWLFSEDIYNLGFHGVFMHPIISMTRVEFPEKKLWTQSVSVLIQTHRFSSLYFCGLTLLQTEQTRRILVHIFQMRPRTSIVKCFAQHHG